MTLEQRIKKLKFNYVNSEINSTNFPGIRKVRGELELYDHGNVGTTEEILEAIKKKELEPANLAELLEYAKERWNGKGLVVALGSSWVDPRGRRGVPCLCDDGGGRGLRLRWGYPGDRWDGRYLFLVVRKSGPKTLGTSDLKPVTLCPHQWQASEWSRQLEKEEEDSAPIFFARVTKYTCVVCWETKDVLLPREDKKE